MRVSAIIVTRGDVQMEPVLNSLPTNWEVVLWDNGARTVTRWSVPPNGESRGPGHYLYNQGEVFEDVAVYGRYAAIPFAGGELIYVQDDDCVVSDPQAIVDAYVEQCPVTATPWTEWWDGVVCNMPQEFRHAFYQDHALVGFGACFHRDAPARAFGRIFRDMLNPAPEDEWWNYRFTRNGVTIEIPSSDFFHRTCDIVFTGLTPRVLVDVPYENLPWATDSSRMYQSAEHGSERQRMLELVRKVRDA